MNHGQERNRTASRQAEEAGKLLVVLSGVFVGGGEWFRREPLPASQQR